MTDELSDSAERLFAAHCPNAVVRAAEAGDWPEALWAAMTAAGFTAALLPEHAGGFGATVAEALGILRVAAAHAAPVPLAETMLAGFLLAGAGLTVPAGVLTVAPGQTDTLRLGPGGRLTGQAARVPWGRNADVLVAAVAGRIACVPAAGFAVQHGANLAGEPRDTLTVDGLAETAAYPDGTLRAAGAAVRTVQIAGALAQTLALCVEYAQTRIQFGRPIGKFQAVQQSLAVLAGQAAAAMAAAEMAAGALRAGLDPFTVGAAKARAGEAASIGAGIAHQVHGAIGITQEYALQALTRRLWSWRDEFGNEAAWNAVVGRAALRAGAAGLWPAITGAA